MTDDEPFETDDVGEAIRDGRPLRRARTYRVRLADGDLNFRALLVDVPVPTGRQVLTSAGLDPASGYSLFAILQTGDFEDVRLDEPFDLRGRGAEQFVAFRTDRDFKLTLDARQLAWGKPLIRGADLYELGNVDEAHAVFVEVEGGEDRLVEPDEIIDLAAPGVERFVTAIRRPRTFEIVVNARPRTVTGRQVTFEQIVELAFPGPHEPNTIFSMTYRHAASTPHAGELAAGGIVVVKNGTIFNVSQTVRS